jgi:sugar phosphate isomerase/epimerase
LKGTLEEKVAAAAEAGLQAVELVNEQQAWSDAEVAKYKRLVDSYRMLRMDTVVGQTDWTTRPLSMVNPAHRAVFCRM